MDQLSGEFLASEASFAINGHMKHSVLPEPVPVETNKSAPSKAVSSAETWWQKGDGYTPRFASASLLKYPFSQSGSFSDNWIPCIEVLYAGDDSTYGFLYNTPSLSSFP